jgi:SpoVK/Ycf46/Vps4 family AAA+-type ATPase
MNKISLSLLFSALLFVGCHNQTAQAISPLGLLKTAGSWIKRGGQNVGSWIKWGGKESVKLLIAQGLLAGVQMLYTSRIAAATGQATESGALQKNYPTPCDADEGLIAPETVPEEINTRVIELIKHPEQLEKVGAKLWRGILLSGVPGTGKTQLGYYIARSTNSRKVYEGAAGMIDAAQGSGSRSIHQLFVRAQQKTYFERIKAFCVKILTLLHLRRAQPKKPTIVIVDEVDAIGLRRGGAIAGGDRARAQERERCLEQLLTELDGARQKSAIPDVFVIATTNTPPEHLDPALIRPGRLKVIDVPQLGAASRQAILRYHANRLKNVQLDVDFEHFVNETAREATGDYLAHAVNDAAAELAADPAAPRMLTEDHLIRAFRSYQPARHAAAAQ